MRGVRRATVGLLAAVCLMAARSEAANLTPQQELDQLKARVAQLENAQNDNWMTTARQDQIKQLVHEVLDDAQNRGQFLDSPVSAGYQNGFYIKSEDGNWKLSIGAFVQYRYHYANVDALGVTAPATAATDGDVNGFDFRRTRIMFTGNAFTPNLTFVLVGEFAGSGTATLCDAYVAYHYSNAINVRAGAYIVPFSYVEYAGPGLSLVDVPFMLYGFDSIRATGISVFGQPVPDKFSYEVMLNNGTRSSLLRRADTVGVSANLDNRMGIYGRVQLAGAGKLSDFADEADLNMRQDPVWMVGFAAGYESQNSTPGAFPAAQNTVAVSLPAANGTGYRMVTLNGDIFRATLDGHFKLGGWGVTTGAYFQQINQNPGSGVTMPDSGSLFQLGYYGQVGYMLIPQRLEVIGRAGQLMTEGSSLTSEEYTIGVSYYLSGHHNQITGDLSYLPHAFINDPTTVQNMNTREVVARLQWQLWF